MAKRFKHVPSGIEVEKYAVNGGVIYRTTKGEFLPAYIIEQGSDWVEIPEPDYWAVDRELFCLLKVACLPQEKTGRYFYFASKEEAEEWALFNKENLSLNDIQKVLYKSSPLFESIKLLAQKK